MVKNYVYSLQSRNYTCNAKLEVFGGIGGQNEALELIPLKQRSSRPDYYYIVGLLKQQFLELFLYEFNTDNCNNFMRSKISLSDVSAISYQVKDLYGDSSLVLFYQPSYQNHIIAQRYHIFSNNNSFEMNSNSAYSACEHVDSKVKVIKSILSPDETLALVCYVSQYNLGECLIYNLHNNDLNLDSYSSYLYDCSYEKSSLNIEYFNSTNEYILYCFQSNTSINLVKLNSDFTQKEVPLVFDLNHQINLALIYIYLV